MTHARAFVSYFCTHIWVFERILHSVHLCCILQVVVGFWQFWNEGVVLLCRMFMSVIIIQLYNILALIFCRLSECCIVCMSVGCFCGVSYMCLVNCGELKSIHVCKCGISDEVLICGIILYCCYF